MEWERNKKWNREEQIKEGIVIGGSYGMGREEKMKQRRTNKGRSNNRRESWNGKEAAGRRKRSLLLML